MTTGNNKENKQLMEFFRFCIVGALCTGIDAGIFYTLINFTNYQLALICGYVFSLIVNYFLTVYWTFKKTASAKNAIGVVVAHFFNLFVIRLGLMYLFTEIVVMSEKTAYVPTLIISVITNFIIIKCIMSHL